MAFHGGRDSSRRGRTQPGSFRGRGSSSRGFQGRGRGRGRYGKPIFDSARIATQETQAENETEEIFERSESEQLQSEDVSSDDEDAGNPTAARPYAALIQSLAEDAGSETKRRKLDHQTYSGGHEAEEAEIASQADIPHDVDEVLEDEEGPEIATDGTFDGDDDNGDSSDPFESHFANPDGKVVSKRLVSIQKLQWSTYKTVLQNFGRVTVSVPEDDSNATTAFPTPIPDTGALKLKQKLAQSISKQRPVLDTIEKRVAPCIFGYHDVLFCERNTTNSETLRRLTCLHAVNHIFKTRDRVIKNNARLAREENDDDLDLRDQGFTRPKVLMLLPTRESCVRMVNMILSICEPEQQENRKRFEDSYIEKDKLFSNDKPADFCELFGGNDDDLFRLGMKFTRKTVKYFSQFYNSDIIFASPLGLRMALGSDGKKVDHDFLSSIEVAIVDQADSLVMQNWEHVEFIFEHLNLQPKEAHGCDFSRVRTWYLDNNAKYFRQTIVYSAFNTPEFNRLFFGQSLNWFGKIKVDREYSGVLQELGLKIKQTFSRLESPSIVGDPDVRFAYFTSSIIPSLTRRNRDSIGTLIFIPSYLDFVRVRNYLVTSPSTSNLSFGSISEYTSVRDVARARSHFFTGRHNILLYTERAHHFRRYQLRGVRKVIMYGLPDNPLFYKEIIGGYLGRSVQEGKLEGDEASVRVTFSKWDAMKLERVVGTERIGKMLGEKGDTFEFV